MFQNNMTLLFDLIVSKWKKCIGSKKLYGGIQQKRNPALAESPAFLPTSFGDQHKFPQPKSPGESGFTGAHFPSDFIGQFNAPAKIVMMNLKSTGSPGRGHARIPSKAQCIKPGKTLSMSFQVLVRQARSWCLLRINNLFFYTDLDSLFIMFEKSNLVYSSCRKMDQVRSTYLTADDMFQRTICIAAIANACSSSYCAFK